VIFVDMDALAETLRPRPEKSVIDGLFANDQTLSLSTVFVAEIAYGVEKIRHEERSPRLQSSLGDRCRRFAGRIYGFDGEASLINSPIMGMAYRMSRRVEVPDGMIAALALRKNASLATRNIGRFTQINLSLINPWDDR
jgi:predicted nucleic acid-binding protein